MTKCRIEDNVLTIRTFGKKKQEFQLNALRLVYLYSQFSLGLFSSKSSMVYIDLNDEDGAEVKDLYSGLIGEVRETKRRKLGDFQFALSDYKGNSAMVKLSRFGGQEIEFIEKLEKYYIERVKLLNEWLSAEQEIRLRGRFGSSVALRRDGVHFRRKFISWREISHVYLETTRSLFTVNNLMLIPHGVSDGMFSFKKYKYSIRNIPEKQKHLYVAECNFWQSRCEDEMVVEEPITRLKV